ncbi:MAG: polysaccharide deacetylase family protein [Oscillospiraceae bacterium]|jgi:predicted glycoside hydrolase/deacetylase ChbG (UPF0249 family)|nr:polysaccharide deacetylase family protein [Oscillospiraceae bacterium]
MAKYLVVNADDFGMCKAANLAVFELFEKGGISSATVMMPCSWAVDACKWAADHPEYPVGVHLTLTSEWGRYRWGPVAQQGTGTLRDKYGYLFPENDEFEDSCDIDEVEAEIRAQVDLALKLGLKPSHLDNHMGSLYGMNGNAEVMPKTFEVCADLGYAFRMFRKMNRKNIPKSFPDGLSMDMVKTFVDGYAKMADSYGVPIVDHLLFTDWDEDLRSSYDRFKEFTYDRLANIDEDEITEVFIHPSLECDELKGITSMWQARVWEHRLFADPETRKYLESKGVQYISYRDVVAMRGKK